jgi:hypothetical protein
MFDTENAVVIMPELPNRAMGDKVVGAYFLYHPKTNKFYVGSGKLYFRKHHHFQHLKNNIHHNKDLQLAYNDDQLLYFYVYKITENQEAAFDAEQELLDFYYPKGMLFNKAQNARLSGIGRIVSDKEKEILRNIKIGIQRPQSVIDKIKLARQNQLASPEANERMRIGNLKRSKQVSLDGVIYDSCRQAARILKIDKSTIVDRINSPSKYNNWYFV